MNKKHPLHDIIIAYANGEKLQYKLSHDNEWYDVYEGPGADSPNFNVENIEWRIKPETKIVRFKLGLFKRGKDNYYVSCYPYTEQDYIQEMLKNIENGENFVKWINGICEVEIEE